MPTAPGRTVAIVVVLVIAVAIPAMLEVVGQREQEVAAVALVTRTTPIGSSIATNQSTGAQLDNGYGRAFVVASAVEGRRTSPMDRTLVAERPGLIASTNPGVDLAHLRAIQQGCSSKQGSGATLGAVVIRLVVISALAISCALATARALVNRVISIGSNTWIITRVA